MYFGRIQIQVIQFIFIFVHCKNTMPLEVKIYIEAMGDSALDSSKIALVKMIE